MTTNHHGFIRNSSSLSTSDKLVQTIPVIEKEDNHQEQTDATKCEQLPSIPTDQTIITKVQNISNIKKNFICKYCKSIQSDFVQLHVHLELEHDIVFGEVFIQFNNNSGYWKWFKQNSTLKKIQYIYRRGPISNQNKKYYYYICKKSNSNKHHCFSYINSTFMGNGKVNVKAVLYHTHGGDPSMLKLST
jgi:hypothetical protein